MGSKPLNDPAMRQYLRDWATALEHDEVSIYEIVGRKAGTRASALPWPGVSQSFG